MLLLVKSSRPKLDEAQGPESSGPDLKQAHSVDSVLLETTAFADPAIMQEQESQKLHPLEQAVLLALCLDVANSNPRDGLTSEQMAPYVQRVLQHPSNWMVYSTALLERSWLDFESSYGRDRAVLQLQVSRALDGRNGLRGIL